VAFEHQPAGRPDADEVVVDEAAEVVDDPGVGESAGGEKHRVGKRERKGDEREKIAQRVFGLRGLQLRVERRIESGHVRILTAGHPAGSPNIAAGLIAEPLSVPGIYCGAASTEA
jgi:hypothetical protein